MRKILGTTLNDMNRPLLPGQKLPRILEGYQRGEPYCISHVFSDSIILVSHNDSMASCLAVLVYALRTMQYLMATGFPIRAGVAYDDMFVDTERSVFVGQAIIKAYDLEQNQVWIGGAIDPSIPTSFPSLFNGVLNEQLDKLFPLYRVPIKTGKVRSLHTHGTRSLFVESPECEHRLKVGNALEYARWVRAAGLAYPVDPEVVPVEVRTFFVGAGPPPPSFSHGDDL